MPLSRLTAIVVTLVLSTALVVGAYLDAQRGTPQTTELSSPILEFSAPRPMPRPLRAPSTATPRRPRASRPATGLVQASRPVEASFSRTEASLTGSPAVSSTATIGTTLDSCDGAGAVPASIHGPVAN